MFWVHTVSLYSLSQVSACVLQVWQHNKMSNNVFRTFSWMLHCSTGWADRSVKVSCSCLQEKRCQSITSSSASQSTSGGSGWTWIVPNYTNPILCFHHSFFHQTIAHFFPFLSLHWHPFQLKKHIDFALVTQVVCFCWLGFRVICRRLNFYRFDQKN